MRGSGIACRGKDSCDIGAVASESGSTRRGSYLGGGSGSRIILRRRVAGRDNKSYNRISNAKFFLSLTMLLRASIG